MKFSIVSATAAFATGAVAQYGNSTVVTEVVTAFTTYCPSATTLVHGGTTYTVTEATTLTITDCQCTKTSTVPVISIPTSASSVPAISTPVSPISSAPASTVPGGPMSPVSPTSLSSASAPYANSTVPITTITYEPSGTGISASSTTVQPYTGAAGRTVAGVGVALAGLIAVVAMIL